MAPSAFQVRHPSGRERFTASLTTKARDQGVNEDLDAFLMPGASNLSTS